MSELLSDIDAPSDAELISRVRGGDVAAYGELFSRHVEAANRLGRQLARGPDVDDLVSEAFAKVLQVLQGGGGPDVAFRAYLLTSVRRLHVDRIRAGAKLQTSDDMSQFDPGIPFQDTAVANFESGAAAKAFASLPERWQLVLWHLEVEEQKPADIAPLLGMSANSVSALAYRAREGLRQAFLTMHLADISAEQCRWVNEHLGAYVRKGLSRRDSTKVEDHLDECRRCTAMYLELTDVNSNLAGIIAPLLLGAAATGYLASTGTAGATGVLALVGRVRDVIGANSGAATAAAVAAGVAAVATAGFLITTAGDKDTVIGADSPIGVTSSAAPNAAPPPNLPTSTSPGVVRSRGSSPSAIVPAADLATPGATTVPGSTTGADPTTGPTTGPSDLAGGPSDLPPGTGPTGAPGTDPSTGPTSDATGNPTNGPTDPTPTTSAPPTTPPATTTPPRPSADLRVGQVSVDAAGTTLSIPLDNIPSDLVELSIDLASTDTTFSTTTTDCVVTPRHADCTPTIAALGAGRVSARLAAPSSYTVNLPLAFPDDMVSDDLTVTVTSKLHDEKNPDDNTFGPFTFTPAPRSHEFDFAMGAVQGVTHQGVVDGRDIYHFSSDIGSVPSDVSALSFDLSGDGARFEARDGSSCAVTDGRVRCTALPEGSSADFAVSVPQGTAVPITVTLAVPAGYTDADDLDNSASTTVGPPPVPTPVDFVLGDLEQVEYDGATTFRVRSHISGVPEDVDELFFDLTDNAIFGVPVVEGADCELSSARVRCFNLGTEFDIEFVIDLMDRKAQPVTISMQVPEGLTDSDLENNTDTIVLTPAAPSSDFAMGPLQQVGDDADKTFTVTSEVSGVPADVHELYFDVAGDVVLGEPGGSGDANCVRAGTGVLCTDLDGDFTLELKVTVPDTKPHVVTVTLALPPGYEDEKHSNNASSITLDADDPALPVANLSISAVSDDKGNSGKANVTVTIGGAPSAEVTLSVHISGNRAVDVTAPSVCGPRTEDTFVCTLAGPAIGDLEFVVETSKEKPSDATLTFSVDAPGYDDPELGNNTDSVTIKRD
jgi:RNA polymerase sigma factor (sigma-70 family)